MFQAGVQQVTTQYRRPPNFIEVFSQVNADDNEIAVRVERHSETHDEQLRGELDSHGELPWHKRRNVVTLKFK